jgi:hypothetical protein
MLGTTSVFTVKNNIVAMRRIEAQNNSPESFGFDSDNGFGVSWEYTSRNGYYCYGCGSTDYPGYAGGYVPIDAFTDPFNSYIGTDNIYGNPFFTDTAAGNFTPRSYRYNNTPTTGLSVNTDYNKTVRGAKPDIGAFEFTVPHEVIPIAIDTPLLLSCIQPQQKATVRIKHMADSVLFFSQNPVHIQLQLTGAVNQSLDTIISTGSLNPGDTLKVNFDAPVNTDKKGAYNFGANVTHLTDLVHEADTVYKTFTQPDSLANSLQTVTFAGYTSNFNTVSKGWTLTNPNGVGVSGKPYWKNLPDTVLTVYMYYYNTAQQIKITSPSFTPLASTYLTFDLAAYTKNNNSNTPWGNTEKLQVAVSTNCGSTYTTLLTIDSLNYKNFGISKEFRTIGLPLAGYTGKNVRIQIIVATGTNSKTDYHYLALNNLSVGPYTTTDLALHQLNLGSSGFCAGETVTPLVSVENKSASTTYNIPVSFTSPGVNPVTISYIIDSLAAFGYRTVSIGSFLADSSRSSFVCNLQYNGDNNPLNDTATTGLITFSNTGGPLPSYTTCEGDSVILRSAQKGFWYNSGNNLLAYSDSLSVSPLTTSGYGYKNAPVIGHAGPVNPAVHMVKEPFTLVGYGIIIDVNHNSLRLDSIDIFARNTLGTAQSFPIYLDNMNTGQINVASQTITVPGNFNNTASNTAYTVPIGFNLTRGRYVIRTGGAASSLTIVGSYDTIAGSIKQIYPFKPDGGEITILSGYASGYSVSPMTNDFGTYEWYPGFYNLQYTTLPCDSGLQNVTVNVNAKPTVNAGLDTTLCQGNTFIPNATGANVYVWSQNLQQGVGFVPLITDTFVVTGTTGGCSAMDTLTVSINNLPAVNAGNDTILCYGSTYLPMGSGADSYIWSAGWIQGTANTVTAGGFYHVTGTDANGCQASDSLLVTLNILPTVNAGNDTGLCVGEVYTPLATGAATYVWTGGLAQGVNTVVTAGVYNVTGIDTNGCQGMDSVIININSLPGIYAGADTTVCSGNSFTPNATGGTSYLWSSGWIQGSSTPVLAGSYFVTGTDANGCVNSDTIIITLNNLPVVDAGNDTALCNGNLFEPIASGAATYVWSAGLSQNVPVTTLSGTYYVTGTDANGCTAFDSIILTIHPSPGLYAGADTTLCPGGTYTPAATGANTYTWSGGLTQGINMPVIAGPYYVTGTDANGCSAIDTINLAISNLPVVYGGADTTICGGDYIPNATGAATYVWSSGLIQAIPAIVNTGDYFVTGTDSYGCSAIDTVSITVTPIPVVYAGADTMLCLNATFTPAATGAITYNWSGGWTQGVNISPTAGVYYVTGTNGMGCTAIDTLVVTFYPHVVWPGDADNNGVADNSDILYMGLAFGNNGTARSTVSTAWQGECALSWPTAFSNGLNHAYSDADGDGLVNYNDTLAVMLNFGLIHAKHEEHRQGNIPLQINLVSDTVTAAQKVHGSVVVGDAQNLVTDLYGIAFTLNEVNNFIIPQSMKVDHTNSWLCPTGNRLQFSYDNGSLSQLWVAQSRINHTGMNGFGTLLDFDFDIDPSIFNGQTGAYIPFELSLDNVFAVNTSGDTIPLATSSQTAYITNPNVGLESISEQPLINVFPNPTRGELNVTCSKPVEEWFICNALGQVVLSSNAINHPYNLHINTTNLAYGLYHLHITTQTATLTKQFIVSED